MPHDPAELQWSARLAVARTAATATLPGDKITLPASSLAQLLAAAPVVTTATPGPHAYAASPQPALPHPITFRLTNPDNGRTVFAGVREFSASDGEVGLSRFLTEALGLDGGRDEATSVIAVRAQRLSKGVFVRLRPLEAGYDADDWRSLLEEHLRANFTTLTRGEILTVPDPQPARRDAADFRFVVDALQPDEDGICIVDTDLEVDIEALNEEQAKDTQNKIRHKYLDAEKQANGATGDRRLRAPSTRKARIDDGEYVDFEITDWNRKERLKIEASPDHDGDLIDLLVSPFGARQRARPRLEEHVFADFSTDSPRSVSLGPDSWELQSTESIYVSIRGKVGTGFTLNIGPITANDENYTNVDHPDESLCANCNQWIPKQNFLLHGNFCIRNNVYCNQGCNGVFQKRSEEWKNHWHCPEDVFYGNTADSFANHQHIFHTQVECTACGKEWPSMVTLAQHRTTVCPGKPILCQFCHLVVRQGGDGVRMESFLAGLTPHEVEDGSRTTECHLCSRIVRLRQMESHLAHHELEKSTRQTPRICRNILCGRTINGVVMYGASSTAARNGQSTNNDFGLCSACYGPLYVAMYDPDGKALKRRVERRYLSQILTGCKKTWCRNIFCHTGRDSTSQSPIMSTREALPLIKPFLNTFNDPESPLHFCVDEPSQSRRHVADKLQHEKVNDAGGHFSLGWCVAALEAESEDLEKTRKWLQNWAPVAI